MAKRSACCRWTLNSTVPLALLALLLAGCSSEVPAEHTPGVDAAIVPCAGSCADGQVCIADHCYDENCAAKNCRETQACVENECVARACLTVDCPENERCVEGLCYPDDCASSSCQPDEVCIGGTCQVVDCVGVSCTGTDVCIKGDCYPTSCQDETCAAGEVCVEGECTDRRCVGITCEGGHLCVAGSCSGCPDDEYEQDGECLPRGDLGAACTQNLACLSDWCVEGLCCDTECAGPCRSCAMTPGTCLDRPAGFPDPACGAFVCEEGGTCATVCTGPEQCHADAFCNGNTTCEAAREDGTSCLASQECASGHCVDGFCCETGCDEPCDSCGQAGREGTCEPMTEGSVGDPACGAYLCDGQTATCPTSCETNPQCAITHYCTEAGVCSPQLVDGESCAVAAECVSGHCVDGVCCDSACEGSCDACNLAGTEGVCSLAPAGSAGSPSCSPYFCPGESAACATVCASSADCARDYFCSMRTPTEGTCEPATDLGEPCSALTAACSSGHCADGVCCDTACDDACASCNQPALRPGHCSPLIAGSAGDPSCRPFLCDGSSQSCPSTCDSDADCVSTHYCDTRDPTTCREKRANGTTCSADNRCLSGHCVDGVCCDTACEGACDACNLSASEGTCSLAPDGSAGSPSCSPYLCPGNSATCATACRSNADCASGHFCSMRSTEIGTCEALLENGLRCAADAECVSGHCADGVCCDTACDGACDSCNQASTRPGHCSPVPAGSPGDPACAPYLCDGSLLACPRECSSNADCIDGHWCTDMRPSRCEEKRPNGSACTVDASCQSGHCVDGVCCDSSCDGSCNACNLAGLEGRCSLAPAGAIGNPPCEPLVCSGTASVCPLACSSDANCASGFWCDTRDGSCREQSADGVACTADNRCLSGHCVDGVCCDTACDGACDSCNQPALRPGHCAALPAGSPGDPSCTPYLCDGSLTKCPRECSSNADCIASHWCPPFRPSHCEEKMPDGSACTADASCQSGHCVDGVCCDTACDGSCNACNLAGSLGRCALVPAGSAGEPACEPFACSGSSSACPTACNSDTTCAAGFWCNGTPEPNECMPKLRNSASCIAHNRCLSGHCVEGVCCDSACEGPCNSCRTLGYEGTCRNVGMGGLGEPSCAPYRCASGSAQCATRCTVTSECRSPASCIDNACVLFSATKCTIAGETYAQGATNPLNDCQHCDAYLTRTDWSDRSAGTSCNHGLGSCDGRGRCLPYPCFGTCGSAECTGQPCGNGCICSAGQCVSPSNPSIFCAQF